MFRSISTNWNRGKKREKEGGGEIESVAGKTMGECGVSNCPQNCLTTTRRLMGASLSSELTKRRPYNTILTPFELPPFFPFHYQARFFPRKSTCKLSSEFRKVKFQYLSESQSNTNASATCYLRPKYDRADLMRRVRKKGRIEKVWVVVLELASYPLNRLLIEATSDGFPGMRAILTWQGANHHTRAALP